MTDEEDHEYDHLIQWLEDTIHRQQQTIDNLNNRLIQLQIDKYKDETQKREQA